MILKQVFFITIFMSFTIFGAFTLNIENSRSAAGKTIHIYIKASNEYEFQRIKETAKQWSLYANINFQFYFNTEESNLHELSYTFQANPGRCEEPYPAYAEVFGFISDFRRYGDGCLSFHNQRTIIHEFGHVLGLEHEHQHPYRSDITNDFYIDENYLNCGPLDEYSCQFNIRTPKEVTSTYSGTSFDPRSIMFYPDQYSAVRGVERLPWSPNDELSNLDIIQIVKMYPGKRIQVAERGEIILTEDNIVEELENGLRDIIHEQGNSRSRRMSERRERVSQRRQRSRR